MFTHSTLGCNFTVWRDFSWKIWMEVSKPMQAFPIRVICNTTLKDQSIILKGLWLLLLNSCKEHYLRKSFHQRSDSKFRNAWTEISSKHETAFDNRTGKQTLKPEVTIWVESKKQQFLNPNFCIKIFFNISKCLARAIDVVLVKLTKLVIIIIRGRFFWIVLLQN